MIDNRKGIGNRNDAVPHGVFVITLRIRLNSQSKKNLRKLELLRAIVEAKPNSAQRS
jgi:hypothetical protein